MNKLLQSLLAGLCNILASGDCRKNAPEQYYGRLDNLQSPMLRQGNLAKLLGLIGLSGYRGALSMAG